MKSIALIAVGLFLPAVCVAAPQMKPGLREMTTTRKYNAKRLGDCR
jgi:hypothetical protein